MKIKIDEKIKKKLGPAKANHSAYWLDLHDSIHGECEILTWTCLKVVGEATNKQKIETLKRVLNQKK